MATINIAPTTASFTATGGQGTITLTDTASASWHDTPQSGDNWAAIREKENGVWSDWFVLGKNYLPLTGGTVTGHVNLVSGSSTSDPATLKFTNAAASSVYARIGANTGGLLQLYAQGNIVLRPGGDITKGVVISTTDITYNGTSLLGGGTSPATDDSYGTVKIAAKRTSSPTLTTGGTTSGRYYGVEMRSDGQLFVNVPWVSGSGGSTVSWGTVSGNTVPLTVDGKTKTVLLSSYAPDLSGYLPLTGGTLTGPLNSRSVAPTVAGTLTISSTGTMTALKNGYDLGTSSLPFRAIYGKAIYLASGVYIYYDTVNGCIRTNAPIVSDSYISAGGVQSK